MKQFMGIVAAGLVLAGCTQQPAPVLSGYTGQKEEPTPKHYTLKALQGKNTVSYQNDSSGFAMAPAVQEESLSLIEPAAGVGYKTREKMENTYQEPVAQQGSSYTFKDGDTLYSVARAHGTTARKLIEMNGLASAVDVDTGQVLVLPEQNMAEQPSAVNAVAMAEKMTRNVQSQVIEKEQKIQAIEPAAGQSPTTGLRASGDGENSQKTLQNSDLKDYSANGGKVVQQGGVRYAEHMVVAGETVYRISLNYKASVFDVMAANDFATPQDLKAGTMVRIPLPQVAETVQQGGSYGVASVQNGGLSEQLSAEKVLNVAETPQPTQNMPVERAATVTIDRSNAPVDEATANEMATGAVTTVEKKTVTTVEQGTIGNADQDAMAKVVTTTRTETKVVSADNADAIMLVQKGRIDPVAAKSKGLAWPVKGKIIRKYGEAAEGVNHTGINIAVPINTPVVAADNGTILYADSGLKTYGNLVLIRHADGMVTAYAHNNKLLVAKGERVKKGQVVALSGQSGNVDSPQVHFEIRKEAHAIDPLRVLASR